MKIEVDEVIRILRKSLPLVVVKPREELLRIIRRALDTKGEKK